MKSLTNTILKLCALSFVLFLASCGEDEETFTIPTIAVTMSNDAGAIVDGDNVEVDQTVSFNVSIAAAGGFNVYRVSGSTTLEQTRTDLGLDEGAVTATDKFDITFTGATVGSTVTFDFVAVDDKDQSSNTTSITLNIVSPEAKVQTAILLYAPTINEDSKTFYSIAEDQEYSKNDVDNGPAGTSAKIDFGYFYVTEANLSSPAEYSASHTGAYDLSLWNLRNASKIAITQLTDVEAITSVADVEAAVAAVSLSTAVAEGLTVGSVYAFETVDGLQGLINVTAIQPGFSNLDHITLEFILATAK